MSTDKEDPSDTESMTEETTYDKQDFVNKFQQVIKPRKTGEQLRKQYIGTKKEGVEIVDCLFVSDPFYGCMVRLISYNEHRYRDKYRKHDIRYDEHRWYSESSIGVVNQIQNDIKKKFANRKELFPTIRRNTHLELLALEQ